MRDDFVPAARTEFLTQIAATASSSGERIVLRGLHGLGMTFMLQQLARRLATTGVTVLRSTGAQAAMPNQLLLDVTPNVDIEALTLPSPYRVALVAVLSGEPVNPRLLLMAAETMFRALSADRPVALLIDDAHLLDASSLSIIEYLVSRPATQQGLSIVLGETANSTEETMQQWRFSPTTVSPLPTVDVEDLARIVHSRTGVRPSRLEAARIHVESCGNPAAALSLLGAARGTVPLRFDQHPGAPHDLDDRDIELLALAAGSPGFSEVELRVLPEHSAALPRLLTLGILRDNAGRLEMPPPGPAGIGVDQIDPARLRELHSRLAAVRTDTVGRAEHLDRAVPPGPSEPVAIALEAAASSALTVGRVGAAADFTLRSLARSGEDAEAAFDRIARAAASLFAMGEFARAANVTDQVALDTLTPHQLDSVLVIREAAVAASRGEQLALVELDELRIATAADPVRASMVAIVRAVTDGDENSLDRIVDALALLAQNTEVPRTRHRATAAVVHASIKAGRGMDDAAIRELGELESELPGLSIANGSLAFVGMHAYQVERLDLARSSLEAARRAALDRFEDVAAGRFAVHLAIVETYAGRLDDADSWLSKWDRIDPSPSAPTPAVLSARLLLALLRDDIGAVHRLALLPTSGNQRQSDVIRLAARGRAAARHEMFEEARVLLTSARDTAIELGIIEPGSRLHLDIDLARAQIGTGRLSEAEESIASLEQISAGSRPLLDGAAARLRALILRERGDLEGAARYLRRALRILPRDGFGSERAMSSLELAEVLLALGDLTEARQSASAALRSARAAGDALVGRLVDGLDLRDTESSPEELLSPREFAVAQAVAAGRTNREIAADNWISVRTVETQLSSAYRKLRVRSRAELAVLIHDSTTVTKGDVTAT